MTCAKQTVTATITTKEGFKFIATNYCYNPQDKCPREGMKTGEGYHLCKEVCRQHAHAEEYACALAQEFAKGSTLTLEGHYYACDNCKRIMKDAGIKEVIYKGAT